MQKRGLSDIITTILIILIVLISISTIWLFVKQTINRAVSINEEQPGEIIKLTSCLDLNLKSEACNFLGNDTYQIKITRGADNLEIKEIVLKFGTDASEIILKNDTVIPGQFGSAIYIYNLSKETQEEVRYVETTAILKNDNVCPFTSVPTSCIQGTTETNGQIFEPLKTYALSWDGTSRENIIPMYQLKIQNDYQDAIQGTSQQPSGFKTIIDRSRYQGINTNESDKCQDPVSGNWYDCIWWDNGVEAVKIKYNNFLIQYSQGGGKLDYWILDTETLLSNWAIGSNLTDSKQLERWRAIQNDPRNTTLFEELRAEGPFVGEDLIGTVYNWSKGGDNYLIWNSYMLKKTADYYNQATYNKIKEYYPNVKISDYGFRHWNTGYPVPEANGHKQYKYGFGAHVGTYQTADGLYGELGQITNPNRIIPGFTYVKTPFNAFRYELNRLRSMQLSSSIEIQPWVTYKGWNKSSIYNNDYYEELIIQLSLTNPENFLFWNPHTNSGETPASNEANDTLFSNALLEADQFIGYANKQQITENYETFTNETWWMSDYVLSGIYAADKKVWRFTPDINFIYTIENLENPVIFKTQEYRITIPQGQIKENDISSIGYWVVQPESAGNPIIEII